MANIHIPLIHSPVDGLLGCFYVLDIVNSASMNIGEHVFRRNKIGSFVEMWMDLNSVIQCEVRIGILLDRFGGAITDEGERKGWRENLELSTTVFERKRSGRRGRQSI